MLGSLLHHLLPELRLLRLMQCDVAVTKNCEMDMVCISEDKCCYLIIYHSLFEIHLICTIIFVRVCSATNFG